MVLVLNLLNSLGTDGSYGNEDSDRSILAKIGHTLSPAFSPIGLDEENWPATVGIFTGILPKEAVVGTLNATYSALAAADADAGEQAAAEGKFCPAAELIGALATIPANLSDALSRWVDPLGLDLGDLRDAEAAAEAQEVSTGTFGAMAARFDGAAGAFAYLLYIRLYSPCVAAIAAIYCETTPGWTVFAALWTTGLGYALAIFFYQTATFARDPLSSATWIGIMLAAFAALLLIMYRWAGRESSAVGLARQGA
jgi:ferrous iron transport protein B